MPYHRRFGVFKRKDRGNLRQGFYADLDEAKRHAQKGAHDEGVEFFVYNFENLSEVARFFPPRGKP
jgi:hypothetical protein